LWLWLVEVSVSGVWVVGAVGLVGLWKRGLDWRGRGSVQHGSECCEELFPAYCAVVICINRLDSFKRLLFIDNNIDIERFEEIIEELSHLLLIESAGFIDIVLIKDLVNVAFKHLVFQVAALEHRYDLSTYLNIYYIISLYQVMTDINYPYSREFFSYFCHNLNQ
jgi:hypothetical protein